MISWHLKTKTRAQCHVFSEQRLLGALERQILSVLFHRVVALEASFPECPAKTFEVPYLRSLPDEISFCADGKTLLHDRFGEGTVFAYIVVFKNHMMPLTYPTAFEDGCLVVE